MDLMQLIKSNKKAIIVFCYIFIIVDLIITFYGYFNQPIDGDLIAISLPAEWYEEVLRDPFSLNAIFNGSIYSGAGRYTFHYFMYLYFNHVPILLQIIVNPIDSVYLSIAFLQTLFHLSVMMMIAAYATLSFSFKNVYFVLMCCFVASFLHLEGYKDTIGIVNNAVTYSISYLVPIFGIAFIFYPFIKAYIKGEAENIKYIQRIMMFILVPLIVFNGPIAIPVLLVIILVYALNVIIDLINKNSTLNTLFQKFSTYFMIYTGSFTLIGYYASQFNKENVASLPVVESYSKLIEGIEKMYLDTPTFILLFLIFFLSWFFLLRKNEKSLYQKQLRLTIFGLAFILIFILIMPLGGYRTYRPYIIRHDTHIPVIITYLWLTGLALTTTLKNSKSIKAKNILIVIVLITTIFMYSIDYPPISNKNSCEKSALYSMFQSDEKEIVIKTDCNIMSWSPHRERYFTLIWSKMLQKWNIIDKDQYYIEIHNE